MQIHALITYLRSFQLVQLNCTMWPTYPGVELLGMAFKLKTLVSPLVFSRSPQEFGIVLQRKAKKCRATSLLVRVTTIKCIPSLNKGLIIIIACAERWFLLLIKNS